MGNWEKDVRNPEFKTVLIDDKTYLKIKLIADDYHRPVDIQFKLIVDDWIFKKEHGE